MLIGNVISSSCSSLKIPVPKSLIDVYTHYLPCACAPVYGRTSTYFRWCFSACFNRVLHELCIVSFAWPKASFITWEKYWNSDFQISWRLAFYRTYIIGTHLCLLVLMDQNGIRLTQNNIAFCYILSLLTVGSFSGMIGFSLVALKCQHPSLRHLKHKSVGDLSNETRGAYRLLDCILPAPLLAPQWGAVENQVNVSCSALATPLHFPQMPSGSHRGSTAKSNPSPDQ